MKKPKNKNEMPEGIKLQFLGLYEALVEQHDSIDSSIASHEKSIKFLKAQKKDIGTEIAYLETLGILPVTVEEVDVENQKEVSQRDEA